MLSQSGESGKAYGGSVSEMSLKDGQEFVWGIPRGSKEGLTWIGHPGKCQKKKIFKTFQCGNWSLSW